MFINFAKTRSLKKHVSDAKKRNMLMRNFYKQLAFGLIAATSPLAIQAQEAEKTDTIYKQTFDPRGSINTMTVENMDGGKGTWNEEVNGGNY